MNIIDFYMNSLTRDKVNKIAIQNGIALSNNELNYLFLYISKNYKALLANKETFDFSKYKEKFSEENYYKINDLINKYINYL